MAEKLRKSVVKLMAAVIRSGGRRIDDLSRNRSPHRSCRMTYWRTADATIFSSPGIST
jgi:hypothetical protein